VPVPLAVKVKLPVALFSASMKEPVMVTRPVKSGSDSSDYPVSYDRYHLPPGGMRLCSLVVPCPRAIVHLLLSWGEGCRYLARGGGIGTGTRIEVLENIASPQGGSPRKLVDSGQVLGIN
jgi:hypothetical protein